MKKYRRIVRQMVTVILISAFISLGIIGCSSSKTDTSSSVSSSQTQSTKLEKSTIYVFIAASLNNAMTEIQEMYSKIQPNITIVINADSSGTLQTQIEQGAECDLFFSAATKQMTDLKTEGYIDSSSISNLLENQVVLIKPKGGKTSVTSFDNITQAKSIALAGESVPVGAYAREIFSNLGILDQVMAMEINEGVNVTAVLAAVSEGSNEVGVVYATDAASVKDKVDIIAMAPSGSLKTPVIYPAGLVQNTKAGVEQKAAASDFLSYLKTDEVMNVFSKYGFSKVSN